MANKVFTGFVIAFWAVMMTALVRVEFFPAASKLTAVPIQQIVRRLFENSETQRLHIRYQGNYIGSCDLTVAPRAWLEAPDAVAFADSPGAYFVQTHLNLRLQVLGIPSRFKLHCDSWFDPRYQLKSYAVHAEVDKSRIDISGDNATKKLAIDSKEFDYADLTSPAALEALGLPELTGLAGLARSPNSSKSTEKLMPVFHSYDDYIEMGGVRQHVYLVDCKSDQYPGMWAKIKIDDQGNILNVETSLGLTMTSGSMDNLASHEPISKTISPTRRLQ